MKIITAVISLVFILNIAGFAGALENVVITDLSGRSYLEQVVQALRTAQSEILMAMYVIKYQPDDEFNPVNKLLYGLVSAKKRGVYVKVVLEYGIQERETGKDANAAVYEFLRDNGIMVVYDTAGVTTHSKVIVIDRRMVIFGSSNWTKTSIDLNNEINALVASKGFAERIRNRILDIKPLYLDSDGKKETAQIPREFIAAGGPVSQIVDRNANRALDVYLWLAWIFRDKEEKTGGFEELAEYLGIAEKMTRTEYRRQIIKIMRRLDRDFGLLSFSYMPWLREPSENRRQERTTRQRRLKPAATKRGVQRGGYTIVFKMPAGPGDMVYLPYAYWEYGWDKELDITAKFCLLINLAERNEAQGEYRWQMPQKEIENKYGAHPWTVTKGMKALQRYDVIDIEYGRYSRNMAHASTTAYIFHGLAPLATARKELAELEAEYGGDYLLAEKYAGIIYKDKAVRIIKRIIGLIKRYGKKKTRTAFEKAGRMSRDNPKRNLGYVIGMLRRRERIPRPLPVPMYRDG